MNVNLNEFIKEVPFNKRELYTFLIFYKLFSSYAKKDINNHP